MKTQSEGTTSAQRIQTERAIEREAERATAAAPQLLEALKAVTATEMFLPDHPQRQAAYKAARAAIYKATQ